jgi:hypothetical protein
MEVERTHEGRRGADLASAVGPEEPAELVGLGPTSPGGLSLERSERGELTTPGEYSHDGLHAERSDQLAFEVGLADEEPMRLEIAAAADGSEPGTFQPAAIVALFARIAETREPAADPDHAERPGDVLRSADRNDRDTVVGKHASAADGERLEGIAVARAFDQDHCAGSIRTSKTLSEQVLGHRLVSEPAPTRAAAPAMRAQP